MGNLPPPEAQEMIEQFQKEEREKAEVRSARRALAKDSEVEIALIPRRRQMTSSEMERFARENGFRIESGNGKHGKHIVAPNGSRTSLPDHPGNLATGTCLSINRFLAQHRETP